MFHSKATEATYLQAEKHIDKDTQKTFSVATKRSTGIFFLVHDNCWFWILLQVVVLF